MLAVAAAAMLAETMWFQILASPTQRHPCRQRHEGARHRRRQGRRGGRLLGARSPAVLWI